MIENLASATERTIRYITPGIWLFTLYVISKGDSIGKTLNGRVEPIVFLIGNGFILYIYFRQVLETYEHRIKEKREIKKISKKFWLLYPKPESIGDYLNFKFANVHVSELLPSMAIFSALAFGMDAIQSCWIQVLFIAANAVVLICAIINHRILYEVTEEIYRMIDSEKTQSEKPAT